MNNKYEFTVPDYNANSIVNVMSSISYGFGGSHLYKQNSSLIRFNLEKFENIVLLVIDGLGFNYLQSQNASFLKSKLQSRLTSVFIPTTACANSVFATGYPPQQTGINSLYMNLTETK